MKKLQEKLWDEWKKCSFVGVLMCNPQHKRKKATFYLFYDSSLPLLMPFKKKKTTNIKNERNFLFFINIISKSRCCFSCSVSNVNFSFFCFSYFFLWKKGWILMMTNESVDEFSKQKYSFSFNVIRNKWFYDNLCLISHLPSPYNPLYSPFTSISISVLFINIKKINLIPKAHEN